MARQKEIPGTEQKTVKELDDAAEHYVEARDKRIAHSVKEKDAKDALISVMRKHGKEVYRDKSATPPLTVTLVPGKDGVKVTEADEGSSESGDEEAA